LDSLTEIFDERLQEIDTYLDLLDALERQVRDGPPKIGGSAITAQQQRILYSAVYLQLYNLVEATVSWCIDAVTEAAADNGRWRPGDLSDDMRREWVRATAHTHLELNQENRLRSAVKLCDRIIQANPILKWAVEKGGGGNWDDHEIENISVRLGCELRIDPAVRTGIKRKVRNDKRPLELVKDLRNRLAHGTLSFSDCGDGVTVVDLRDIKERTANYLRAVLLAFRRYIDTYEFLAPTSRPAAGG